MLMFTVRCFLPCLLYDVCLILYCYDLKVNAAKSRGKVYSVTFVGINGVGKSTSLAKVAYYLKENGVKVLVTIALILFNNILKVLIIFY